MQCVVIVVSMGLAFAAENVWNYVVVLKRPVSWIANELSFFFCPWVYSITYTLGASYLIINAILASRRLKRDRARSQNLGGPGAEEAVVGGGEIGIDTFVGAIINEADDDMVVEDMDVRVGDGQFAGFASFGINEETQQQLDGMGIDGVEFGDTLPVSRLPEPEDDGSNRDYFAPRSTAPGSSAASQEYRTAGEDDQDALELTLTDSGGSSYKGDRWQNQ
ncbi:hypothetical protein OIV83_005408 [Microbotryomycetes sp. JL201]|nr:hypothetical protein OIV83_005408 [Microbotryomycetes sp. JL201]